MRKRPAALPPWTALLGATMCFFACSGVLSDPLLAENHKIDFRRIVLPMDRQSCHDELRLSISAPGQMQNYLHVFRGERVRNYGSFVGLKSIYFQVGTPPFPVLSTSKPAPHRSKHPQPSFKTPFPGTNCLFFWHQRKKTSSNSCRLVVQTAALRD